MRFIVRTARWEEDKEQLYEVRRIVFIEEQKVPAEIEIDEWDEPSLHVLALDEEGRPIGCGRLLPDGHVGRMAVLASWRGRGVGMALLTQLVELADLHGHKEIVLSSQVHALPFYQKAGFVPYGDVYQEAGIPHRAMRLSLHRQPPS